MSFILGVLSSLTAVVIVWIVKVHHRRLLLRASIGPWLEEIHGSERPVSISYLKFDNISGKYTYGGTNYFPDGRPHYEWRTETIKLDASRDRLFYIYKGWKKGTQGEEEWGWGFIRFDARPTSKGLVFREGHYRSSRKDAPPRSTTMHRLKDVCHRFGMAPETISDPASERELVRRFCASREATGERSELSPSAHPKGRADAPSGSVEA